MAVGIVVFARDRSPLWIGALGIYIIVAFLGAYALSNAWMLTFLSLPLGFYLAWLARDELVPGRPWFMIVIGAGLVLMIIGYGKPIMYAGLSITLCSALALILSYKRGWARARGTWESRV